MGGKKTTTKKIKAKPKKKIKGDDALKILETIGVDTNPIIEDIEDSKEDEFSETGNLTIKQSKFCDLYVNGDKELFGNGVASYLEIYSIDRSKGNWYNTACACASRLLSNAKVINEIKRLLEEGGFTEENVEKQHLFLINQFADLKTKRAAISDFYRVKGKFIDKTEHTGLNGGPIQLKYAELTDDQLKQQYEQRIKTKG